VGYSEREKIGKKAVGSVRIKYAGTRFEILVDIQIGYWRELRKYSNRVYPE
jgi:hypothetical protein